MREHLQGRVHFVGVSANVIRRVLVDYPPTTQATVRGRPPTHQIVSAPG